MKWIKALDLSPISASQNTDPVLFTWLITLHLINRNRFCFNWRTFQMSRNLYCRVTQTQMQDALKGNAFKQPFSFDFQHQFPTHSSTTFFEDSWFFFSDQLLFWKNVATQSFECISKPIFSKMLFGNLKLNFLSCRHQNYWLW